MSPTEQDVPTAGEPTAATPKRRRTVLVVTLLVIAVAGALLVAYLGRDTPAAVDTAAAIAAAGEGTDTGEEADADTDGGADDTTDDTTDGDDGGADTDAGEDATGALPESWRIDTDLVPFDFDAGTGTFVGYRIDEELSTVGATTAVGRTAVVEGELRLEGSSLVAATITGDLTALVSDIPNRDGRVQRALDTDTHPTTTFALTEAVDLGAEPTPGDTVRVSAAGELTLHGVTQPTLADIEAVLLDTGRLLVTGSFEVVLSDHDIVAPSAPIVVSVADTGTIEFQLYLTPA